jgi:fructokinase
MRLGIDLGGTKIEILALDHTGLERYRRRAATPRGSYEGTLTVIADLVRAAEWDAGTRGTIGIAVPGAISPATGLVKNANSTWLNGRRLQADIEALLDRPVRLTNDANCFALSEATDGAGAGVDVVFGVIAGTGTGGGVVVRGQVCTGPNAIAGEWGHNPLPWPNDDERPGPACYCGKRGCIETFLSGPGMAADHERATGVRLDTPAIVGRAAAGDSACEATLARYERRMARALATVINILDPDVIVLGGGMSNIGRLYERVPPLLPEYVFSDHVTTRLLRPVHGDSSGVRGAAWLGGQDGK